MKSFIFVCCLILLISCVNSITLYKQHEEPQGVLQERTVHSFLFGFVGIKNTMKVWRHCPDDGWQSITVLRTGMNILQAVLTVGLYTPSTIKFVCYGSLAVPLLMEEDVDLQEDSLRWDF